MLTHGNLLASVEALRLAWRWTPEDRLVLALPLFHAHGLCVGLHGTLLCGGSVVLLPRFDVDVVLDAARDEQGTLFFGVPTMYARLASSDRAHELSRLRLCVSGSAPLPADLHRELAARGGTRVLERYGMTETLMNASNPYDGDRRPGSVGIPLPRVDITLSADTAEIRVRGPNIFPGYWERPDATAESFTGGWFHTGDIGALDDDGYLTHRRPRARSSSSAAASTCTRVRSRTCCSSIRASREVAVIGTPSDEWGETVTAVVVAEGAPDEAALLEYAAEELASFKRPRIVRYVASFPATPSARSCAASSISPFRRAARGRRRGARSTRVRRTGRRRAGGR